MSKLFTNVKDWKSVEADLKEQGFSRPKLLIIYELWYRLQIKNIVDELTPKEIEDALGVVAEAYDELLED
jgi:hypothetical protein